MDAFDAHEQALDAAATIVAGVHPSQFDWPTPCTDFDVKALLDHMIAGNLRFVAFAAGDAGEATPATGKHVVDGDALTPYRVTARAVGAAWRDPAMLDGTYRLPIGEVPGTFAIGIHTVEAIVHGWDLATATGQPTEIAPDLCAVAWQTCQLIDDSLRGPGGPFGPAVDAPDGATDTDRLVAWLGRAP